MRGERRSLRIKFTALVLCILFAGGAAYYQLVYRPKHRAALEIAYVLPDSANVVDTTAAIQSTLATLKEGDQVNVVTRARDWAKVRLASGLEGWMDQSALIDQATFDRGESLLREIQGIPPQAAGHASDLVNVRLDPSRDGAQLAQLASDQRVGVYERRIVDRVMTDATGTPTGKSSKEVWYLIKTGKRAGWVVGRLITLDPPEALSQYTQGVNTVAWLVLKTVNDGGRPVPEYLVADRIGTDQDFNHIRVFTWWVKDHKYVTAYVESNLNGTFPIRVEDSGSIPIFRLRLTDDQGRHFQKVYGLYDTITRPIGIVNGWESDAMPVKGSMEPRREKQR
jgi:hypothetical protein